MIALARVQYIHPSLSAEKEIREIEDIREVTSKAREATRGGRLSGIPRVKEKSK